MHAPHPAAMTAPLLLLRNADVHAPEALGLRHLLLGGGKVLWMGDTEPALPDALDVEVLELDAARLVPGFIDGSSPVRSPATRARSAMKVMQLRRRSS